MPRHIYIYTIIEFDFKIYKDQKKLQNIHHTIQSLF